KRVIRSKIVREGWMNDNGLSNVMEVIKSENGKMLFKQDCSFMLILVKEFYAKMKVTHLRKKDVIKSSVKGIDIEFDHEKTSHHTWCAQRGMEYVNTSKKYGRNQNTQSHLRLQEGLQMMRQSQFARKSEIQ
ncbi:hypothetical protein Dimus_036107, partial [Dionaea muscipula]